MRKKPLVALVSLPWSVMSSKKATTKEIGTICGINKWEKMSQRRNKRQ